MSAAALPRTRSGRLSRAGSQVSPRCRQDRRRRGEVQAVSEAYEVLKDPDKRKKYDTLGANWKAGQEFTPPPGWDFDFSGFGGGQARGAGGPGGGFGGGGFSDFFEAIFGNLGGAAGAQRQRRSRPRKGQTVEGELRLTLEDVLPRRFEDDHAGVERSDDGQRQSKNYTVKIPVGVRHGSTIRLAGQGLPAPGGGEAGDLMLKVIIADHARFRVVEGHDVTSTLPLSPWEAALGTKAPVYTLDGSVTLTIPAGSQSGQKLRLRGKGLPKRGSDEHGDMFVELKIRRAEGEGPDGQGTEALREVARRLEVRSERGVTSSWISID